MNREDGVAPIDGVAHERPDGGVHAAGRRTDVHDAQRKTFLKRLQNKSIPKEIVGMDNAE